MLVSILANFDKPTNITINAPEEEAVSPIVFNIEGDSSTFERKVNSLLALDPETVPTEDYLEVRIGQGTAKLISLEARKRDDLIRSTTPLALLLIIPIYSLLVRLFNLKKKRFFVDDVVFVSHILSITLLASLATSPISMGLDETAIAQVIWSIWTGAYFLVSYKRVYTRGYGVAIIYGSFQFIVFLLIFGAALVLMLLYIVYFKV